MELLLLFIIYILYIFIKNYIETGEKPSDVLNKYENAVSNYEKSVQKRKEESTQYVEPEKTTINNYYTQNNTYVQQNNYNLKSNEENKDHSERVWNRLGYKIKQGETYSYKFYGNEIYTPEQVEQIECNQVKYSESGLTKKLLKDTKSKSLTQKILVDSYGLSKSEAKRLTNIY